MAQFFIQLDKEIYHAGETINGNINIVVYSFIHNITGISLKFTGFQSVKWIQYQLLLPITETKRNGRMRSSKLSKIPQKQIYHTHKMIEVSDIESDDEYNHDHRPKYVKVSKDTYEMKYYQVRNFFTKNIIMLHNCQQLPIGQYCFPFSFKTFEGWPANFEYIECKQKAKIVYNLKVAIQSQNQDLNLSYQKQIPIKETKLPQINNKFIGKEVQYCWCMNDGLSTLKIFLEKDGYRPQETILLSLEVDNIACAAKIQNIQISVQNTISLKAKHKQINKSICILNKSIKGLEAKQKCVGPKAIREQIKLSSKFVKQLKPSCFSKLIVSSYSINVKLNHKVSFPFGMASVDVTIPFIIYPYIRYDMLPQMFRVKWFPQIMPLTNFIIKNQFPNFDIQKIGQIKYKFNNNQPSKSNASDDQSCQRSNRAIKNNDSNIDDKQLQNNKFAQNNFPKISLEKISEKSQRDKNIEVQSQKKYLPNFQEKANNQNMSAKINSPISTQFSNIKFIDSFRKISDQKVNLQQQQALKKLNESHIQQNSIHPLDLHLKTQKSATSIDNNIEYIPNKKIKDLQFSIKLQKTQKFLNQQLIEQNYPTTKKFKNI